MVGDLVYAIDDPWEEVRNNSVRALGIIAKFALQSPDLKIRVPTQRFIRLLNSPVWSDLNKASFALMELSSDRNPVLLTNIRKQAVGSLVDMARWKSEGHAGVHHPWANRWLVRRRYSICVHAWRARNRYQRHPQATLSGATLEVKCEEASSSRPPGDACEAGIVARLTPGRLPP